MLQLNFLKFFKLREKLCCSGFTQGFAGRFCRVVFAQLTSNSYHTWIQGLEREALCQLHTAHGPLHCTAHHTLLKILCIVCTSEHTLHCTLNTLQKQGSSENDGISDVYDRSEFKVISNCCYTNCCRTNFGYFTCNYLNLPEFT